MQSEPVTVEGQPARARFQSILTQTNSRMPAVMDLSRILHLYQIRLVSPPLLILFGEGVSFQPPYDSGKHQMMTMYPWHSEGCGVRCCAFETHFQNTWRRFHRLRYYCLIRREVQHKARITPRPRLEMSHLPVPLGNSLVPFTPRHAGCSRHR